MSHAWDQIPLEDRIRVLSWLEHLRPEPGLCRGADAARVELADARVSRAIDAARALLLERREGACAAEGSR